MLSAVCVAATDSNATFGALADRVEWTRVNDKASYDWPNSTLRHFSPAEAMDLVRGRHVLVLGNSVARHVVVALHMLIGGRAPDARGVQMTRHPRTTFILVTPPHTQCDDRTIRKSEKLCKRGENRSALEAYDAAAVEAATPFDGVVALPIGEATARGLSEGALRHEDTNPYHFHDAGRLFVLEMLLNAFAIATSRRPPH